MVLLFQCKYRCVKLNMLKLAPKTEQDSIITRIIRQNL